MRYVLPNHSYYWNQTSVNTQSFKKNVWKSVIVELSTVIGSFIRQFFYPTELI